MITSLPSFGGQSLPDTPGAPDSERHEGRKADPPSPSLDATTGKNDIPTNDTTAANASNTENTGGGVNEPPDVSADFRSEMAAIRAHYAAMIAAARRRMPGSDLAAVIRALLNEETIALRAVAERWQAATQKQRNEKPQRPTASTPPQDGTPQRSFRT